MTIEILFASAIKQKISNYPWLAYEGYGNLGKEPWSKKTDNYWDFERWIINRFADERLDKRDFCNLDKEILVLALKEDISTYEFFKDNGKLADLYKNDKLDELYEEYLKDRNNKS